MSKAADKALEASMGRRRARDTIRQDVAESILGEMVPAGVVEVAAESLYRSPFQVRVMGNDILSAFPGPLIAGREQWACHVVAEALHGGFFRVYSSDDIAGVEIGLRVIWHPWRTN